MTDKRRGVSAMKTKIPNHLVVTSHCQLFLITDDKKAPYLLVKAHTAQGEVNFALHDKKALRQLAKDIIEELPEPKKRTRH